MGQAGGAVGRGHAEVDQAVEIFQAPAGQAPLEQFEAADDAGQHIVEVVGDAAGQLADRLHLLRLAQRFFVMAQLGGALLDLLFQGLQGVLEAPFALAQVDQPVTGLVLPAAPTNGRGHQADQRHRVKGAFQEADIAQLRAETGRGRPIRAAVMGHQHNGQVRPRRLFLQVLQQWLQVRLVQGLGRHDQQAGATLQLAAQGRQARGDHAGEAGLGENHPRDLAVATPGCQDDRSFGNCVRQGHKPPSLSNGRPSPR